ncbi:MAG TPA: TonB-dependent receptor [Thermoanaerobaculia bacterium]|nr:TonB-dependent receptor [Thermoanaerobaculia bacterium]
MTSSPIPWIAGLLALVSAGAAAAASDAPPPQQEPTAAAAAAGEETPPEERIWYDETLVTATRDDRAAGAIPLASEVIAADELEATPDHTVLDLLREVPSVNLARGAGELVAQPRDQGLSFRGIVSGTVSRALALVDGLPLVDPYGGFVIWSQVPKEVVERVEIVRGGGSSAWGSLALSGVVNLITRAPSERTWSAMARLGTKSTRELNLFYSDLGDRWAGWVAGYGFDTDGYVDFDPALRGPIDEAKKRDYEGLTSRVVYSLSSRSSLRLGASFYSEDREQGLPLDRDRSFERSFVFAFDASRAERGDWQLQLFHRDLDTQSFSSEPNEERTDATPTSNVPRLPTTATGASVLWSAAAGGRHALTAGADFQTVDVERVEDFGWVDDHFTVRYTVRGRQQLGGLFVQESFSPAARWTLSFGARADRIRTSDAESRRTSLETGEPIDEDSTTDNVESTLSPSAGLVFAVSKEVHLRAAVYTGFRSPTASELFVGSISSGSRRNAPNPELEPETLVGAELGFDLTPSRAFSLRLTGFWNEVEGLVQRLTVGRTGTVGEVIEPCGFVPPRGSCTQRRNLGEIRSTGAEIDAEWRPAERWRLRLDALWNDAEITENPTDPSIVGNRVERAVEEQVSLAVSWAHPRFGTWLVRGRQVSDRFEDPENELLLPGHELLDLSWSLPLGDAWELFAGVENVLDESYIARVDSDGDEYGAPRLYQVGFRLHSRGGR